MKNQLGSKSSGPVLKQLAENKKKRKASKSLEDLEKEIHLHAQKYIVKDLIN